MVKLEPLTEHQMIAITNLQQSAQQAEDALSQGMEALQQSLADTLAGSLAQSNSAGNVASYMGQMAMAMGKLGTLENFICQVILYCISLETHKLPKLFLDDQQDDVKQLIFISRLTIFGNKRFNSCIVF